MTAKEAVFKLCEEYDVEVNKNGEPRYMIANRVKWIEKNVSINKIEWFLDRILENYNSNFRRNNQLPSIFDLKQILHGTEEELKIEAAEHFQSLLNKQNMYRDFTTDNPRLQAGLISIGGWNALCFSNPTSHSYMRERFVNAYAKCDPDKISLRVEKGKYSSGKLIFIGKDEKKLEFLNHSLSSEVNQIINNVKSSFRIDDVDEEKSVSSNEM